MKYTKYGIAFGMVIVTAGIALTIKYGYRPAPTRIMKPSFFDSPEEIGTIAMKRFFAQLASEKVVVLGLPTNRDWSSQFARGFINAAAQNQREFALIVAEQALPEEIRTVLKERGVKYTEINTNTQTLAELADITKGAFAGNEKTLIVVPNLYSTHLLEGNPITRLEKLVELPGREEGKAISIFAMTVGPLALEPAQEIELDPICLGSERDGSGTADLGCAILQAGRSFYRKRILETEKDARSRFVAIMQAPRPNDFLLLVREPSTAR